MKRTTKLAVLATSAVFTLAVAVNAVAFGQSPTTMTLVERAADEATSTSTTAARPAASSTTVAARAQPSQAPTALVARRKTPVTTSAPAGRSVRTRRTILVGDSITAGYPGGFGYAGFVRGAAVVGGSGGDAMTHRWADQLRALGAADEVVLQDYVIPASLPQAAWEAAWVDLVAAAYASGGRVYILVGPTNAAFLSSLRSINIAMPPADHVDGIHYSEAGATALANLVAARIGH